MGESGTPRKPVEGHYIEYQCPDCRGNRVMRVNGRDYVCAQCDGQGTVFLAWDQLELFGDDATTS